MHLAEQLLDLSLSPLMLLLLIFLISALESLAVVGLLVPGVVLVTAAASMAGHQDVEVAWLLIAAFLGAVVGDGVSFKLGYDHREQVTKRWPLAQHPEWLGRGARFFERYGIYSVFIGRFVGPVRPIIPLVAGMMRMPPRTFLLANIASAIIWAPAYVLPGYLLGHTWQRYLSVPPNIENAVLVIAAIVVVLAVGFSWGRAQVGRHGRLYLMTARAARRLPFTRRPWLAMSHSGEVPLASLLLFVIAFTSFCAWTLYVLKHPEALSLDLQAQRLFTWLETPALHTASLGFAKLGDKLGITILILPWAAWLLARRRLDVLLHWAAALGGIALLNTLGKAAFGRARPDTPEYLVGSLSYPSAHTSGFVVVVGLAAAFIAGECARKYRVWIYWVAIALVVPMALSRLMLGVHWLSDLIGGALLGLTLCALVRLSWQSRRRAPLPACPLALLLGATLVLMGLRIAYLPLV
ncbi:bifunctional DedA family/phosphatase PAP2 family protein [Halomonas sp. 707D7]|uniref:bifunctional DedA family/phosphatase PAP2 family protein n=1 Tax=Halomonas sp. 707D7 TaxID=1681044 RepID=UPI0020A0A870|nr:bifunctional DedA family/phosphatase PAP2 family protein [Halomonas sp. 707D7]